MTICLIGESCTGKSTIAQIIKEKTNATIYSGKDYLRLAKNPVDAKKSFMDLLTRGVNSVEHFIYVISESEQLELIPQGAKRVVVKADLSVIKARFANRMNGKLPAPVELMLERKHGVFDQINCDLTIDTTMDQNYDDIYQTLQQGLNLN